MNTRSFLKAVGVFCLWPFVPKKPPFRATINFEDGGQANYRFVITETDPLSGKWIQTTLYDSDVDINDNLARKELSRWKKNNSPDTLIDYQRI